ncbi:MAG: STAS domain-containing protein [Acidobacteriota bacterium]
MATHIRQIEDDTQPGKTTLRVEGEMTLEDARLIERLADELVDSCNASVTIDLADLDFLDSESAPILKRLAKRDGMRIEGMEIFLQTVVDEVEKR